MRILSFIIFTAIILSIDGFGQSPHGDLKGMDCIDCHESNNWKINPAKNSFDHAKTGFVLSGQHRVVNCASCHLATVIPRPVRFSPEDHYAAYRRRAKESVLREKGWL